jgi:hypothetical protein
MTRNRRLVPHSLLPSLNRTSRSSLATALFVGLVSLLIGLPIASSNAGPLYQEPESIPAIPACRFQAEAAAPPDPAQPGNRIEQCQFDGVVDWQTGSIDGLLITNNAGGELRLAGDSLSGSFISAPFIAPFPVNAIGAIWRVESQQGAEVTFQIRGSPLAPNPALPNEGWSEWRPLIGGDARSMVDDGAYVTPNVELFPPDTRYFQIQANLTSTVSRASAVLDRITIAFLNTTREPEPSLQGLPRAPIAFGPATLTPRPTLVQRATWSGSIETSQPERSTPRGIVIHQVDAIPVLNETLGLLRALAAYQIQALGWEDMAYHYLIDESGIVYEGRLGGPTSSVEQFPRSVNAVHIALIGGFNTAPNTAAQGALINLLAWLGQAYGIDPIGRHTVIVDDKEVTRPNIVAHSDIDEAAGIPGQALRDLLPQLRTRADQSTIRARWYFAEGNIAQYTQRFAFFNPTGEAASATVTVFRPGEDGLEPVTRIVTIPAERRTDLNLSTVVSATTILPSIVESNAPILAERSLTSSADITSGPGITQLSRIWYFAEGSTDNGFQTYLVLFNPQSTPTTANVTYIKGDGTLAQQAVRLEPNQRVVITVGDATTPQMRNVGFGTRIIANQPIAVERTMRFGADGAGLHTGRGIVTLSRRWHFAEGTTQGAFQMRLLLLNPNNQAANTTVTFMGPDNASRTRRYAIPPTTRLVVDANEVFPDTGIATMVESDRPLAVERALYFDNNSAGTVSAGATEPAYVWRFVEGSSANAREFLLISNPNARAAAVDVEFIFGDGRSDAQRIVTPPNSRYTLAVHEFYPGESSIAAVVRSTQPIIAERSLFPGDGTGGGGATTLGFPADQ